MSQTQRRSSGTVKVFWREYGRDEAVKRLVNAFKDIHPDSHIKAIILHGSVAENRHTPSSDVDLLVIVEETSQDMFNYVREKAGIRKVEPHIYTAEQFRKALKGTRFRENLINKSIIIYPPRLAGRRTTLKYLQDIIE